MAKRTKRAPHRRKLTESIVRSLQPGEIVWDALLPAFGARVGQRSKTWIAAVVRPGARHPVRLKLGSFPAMSLADARQAARKVMAGDTPPAPVLFGKPPSNFWQTPERARDGRCARQP